MSRELRFVAFRLGPETFLIDIMTVRQIVPYVGSTHVPTAPPFVEGVMVVRNEAVPVVDLAARLYPNANRSAEHALVLLIHTPAGTIGLKVDEVRRMATLDSSEILPAPEIIRGVRGEFLVGIARHHDEVLLLLDVDAILSEQEQDELKAAHLPNAERQTPNA